MSRGRRTMRRTCKGEMKRNRRGARRGNDETRKDKVMPYGELSYLISGKLEIVPKETGVPVIVSPGDFVTFPEGFESDWTVLEELTWHYYLY